MGGEINVVGGHSGSSYGGGEAASVREVYGVKNVNNSSTPSAPGETIDEEYGYIWVEEPVSFIIGGAQRSFPAKENLAISAINQYTSGEFNTNVEVSYLVQNGNNTVVKTASGNGVVSLADIKNEYNVDTIFLGITTTELNDGSTTQEIAIGTETVEAALNNSVVYNGKEYIWNGEHWVEDDLSVQSLSIYMPAAGVNASSYGIKASPNLVTSSGSTASKKRSYSSNSVPIATMFRSTDKFQATDYLQDNIRYICSGTLSFSSKRPYKTETDKKTKKEKKTVYPYTLDKKTKTDPLRPYVVLSATTDNSTVILDKNEWESGSIADATGSTAKATTRIRTKKFLRKAVEASTSSVRNAFCVRSSGEYKFSVYRYTAANKSNFNGCLTTDGTYKKADAGKSLSDVAWLDYFVLESGYYYKFVLRNNDNVNAKVSNSTHFIYCYIISSDPKSVTPKENEYVTYNNNKFYWNGTKWVTGSGSGNYLGVSLTAIENDSTTTPINVNPSPVFYPLANGYAESKDTGGNEFGISKEFSYEFKKMPYDFKDLHIKLDVYTPNPKKWKAESNVKLDYSWSLESFVIRPKNSTDEYDGVGNRVNNIYIPNTSEISVYASDDKRYFRKVRLSKVEKGELNRFGSLEVKAQFECLSPWREPFSGYIFHGTEEEVTEDPWKGNQIVIESDSSSLGPCELAIQPHSGSTFVNPAWRQYVNNELIAEGKMTNLTLHSSAQVGETDVYGPEALFINSDIADHGALLRIIEENSNIEENTYTVLSTKNVYGNFDFTKSNFIYIRQGVNVIQIKDDNNNTNVHIRLRGNICYESV